MAGGGKRAVEGGLWKVDGGLRSVDGRRWTVSKSGVLKAMGGGAPVAVCRVHSARLSISGASGRL